MSHSFAVGVIRSSSSEGGYGSSRMRSGSGDGSEGDVTVPFALGGNVRDVATPSAVRGGGGNTGRGSGMARFATVTKMPSCTSSLRSDCGVEAQNIPINLLRSKDMSGDAVYIPVRRR